MARCEHGPNGWSPGCKHDPRRGGSSLRPGFGYGYVTPYMLQGQQFIEGTPSEGEAPDGGGEAGGGDGGGGAPLG